MKIKYTLKLKYTSKTKIIVYLVNNLSFFLRNWWEDSLIRDYLSVGFADVLRQIYERSISGTIVEVKIWGKTWIYRKLLRKIRDFESSYPGESLKTGKLLNWGENTQI